MTQMVRMQIYSFGPIWDLFTDAKPKILLKTKNSKKPISLGISNNISPSFQKNSYNSCKNNQNKLGPKLGINCGLRPRQRLPEILTQLIIGPSILTSWMPSSVFGYLLFSTSPRRKFFLFMTQLDPFFYLFYFVLFYYIYFLDGRGGRCCGGQ